MAATTSVTLLTIHEDVQLLIVAYLSTPDLYTLCLAHSQLRKLAQPFLYSSVDLTWKLKDRKWTNPVVPLLRTILGRPELANYIRTVKYTKVERHLYGRHGSLVVDIRDSPLQQAIAFVNQTELPYRDSWLHGIRKRTIEAYLAVLFTQLPSLRALHLGPDLFVEHAILGQVLRSLLCNTAGNNPPVSNKIGSAFPGALPGSLSCLQVVQITRTKHGYEWHPFIPNTANLLPFFHIPSLEAVTLDIDPPVEGALSPTLPQPCKHLRCLTLKTLRESHLAQLISLAPSLRSFHWRWYHFHSLLHHPHNTPIIDLDLILPALEPVKNTLTELNIHAIVTDEWATERQYPVRVKGSARGLATFHQLKKLTIPLGFLTGLDASAVDEEALIKCLPPNLENITLLDDLYRNADASGIFWEEELFTPTVVAWLEHMERYVDNPTLKRLCLGFADHSLESSDEEGWEEAKAIRREIRAIGHGLGIQVTIDPYLTFPSTGWE